MLFRSLLFIPGNTPRMLINANVLGADAVIFDLEDAVALAQKDAARHMIRNFLRSGLCGCRFFVRVNDVHTPYFAKDVAAVVPLKPLGIMLPKVAADRDIVLADEAITRAEEAAGLQAGSTVIMPLAETALGVENAFSYVQASARIKLLAFGGEDFATDLGVKRTKQGEEIDYARKKLVVVAKALGKLAIDTVFVDTADIDGLRAESEYVRGLGFDGKAVISPRHVETVNQVFSPTEAEIHHAQRVIEAMREAEQLGLGAVSLDGKMLDAPILARAKKVLEYAEHINGAQPRGGFLP